MRLAPIGACILMATCSAHAAEQEQEELTEKDVKFITDSVNLLSDCSGLYRFMAQSVFTDKPATSKQLMDYARGAQMAAGYLLSIEATARDGRERPVKDFLGYVDGRADSNKTRLDALLEQGEFDALKIEQTRCTDAMPMQTELVQKLRDSMVGR